MTIIHAHGFSLPDHGPFPVPAAAAYSDAALAASAGSFPGLMVSRNVAWGPMPWQRFDIFAPPHPGPAVQRPVLVFFHGGGWKSGYKEWCGFMAPSVAALGGIMVAPTYRLAPRHRFPVFLRDCLAALAAVRAHIPAYGGDPDRLFVSGHSAGGHLAALAALRPDYAEDVVLPDGAIRGVLPVSGILDLRHPSPAPGSLEAMVYTDVLADRHDDVAASPVVWAARSRIPFALAWGEKDTPRVHASNLLMARALSEAGLPHETHCYPGLDHFGTHLALRDPAHPWYAVLGRMMETL